MTGQLLGLLASVHLGPLHLGPLHPVEQAITIALAFGPFLLLGVAIMIRRRQDRRLEENAEPSDPQRDPQRDR
ncbi:hypothetical protein [Nocardioides pantholopis]|uniref:hypothetical protein n=1 Tax=Nocardioides pantholopis TaxID=2483798 RepID=UPI000F08F6BA|nr:hypothetical protein [Nocardioides pantholopis]